MNSSRLASLDWLRKIVTYSEKSSDEMWWSVEKMPIIDLLLRWLDFLIIFTYFFSELYLIYGLVMSSILLNSFLGLSFISAINSKYSFFFRW